MRNRIVFLLLLISNSVRLLGQEAPPTLVKIDDSWGREIIAFPIDWAPKVALSGYEELRFAPGWDQEAHPNFWSMVIVWNVTQQKLLTVSAIATNMKDYFDGLMKPNHWATDFPEPSIQLETISEENTEMTFMGTLRFFDGFHTGKLITVQLQGSQHFCADTDRSLVLFRMSPQTPEHDIWTTLNAIKLLPSSCEPDH
ncbi:MAG: hypothetical protein MK211_02730 [Flavobacteriales bacterium]|jgi:hypothetical protein|uniref:hypothetical protein n=1 Tax=Candidatus Ulvibacter alkanivorans TaxID=2267620 RepID=UPI00109D1232|nr:hypothetical protein [Candidatus Ulvibacter alkanivorans]MCH2489044.1 hypothetical protein [Flavobacteriales bacterium]